MVQGNPDAGLFVKFYKRAVKSNLRSKEAGYDVYEDVDYIRMIWDNGDSELDIPVRDSEEYSDIKRFPEQWAAYQAGKGDVLIGLPLTVFFADLPAKAKNYEAHNIYTVEQLAASSDTVIQECGLGALEDQKLCQAYLNTSDRDKAFKEREAKLVELSEANGAQAEQIKEMQAMILKLTQKVNSLPEKESGAKRTRTSKKSAPVEEGEALDYEAVA